MNDAPTLVFKADEFAPGEKRDLAVRAVWPIQYNALLVDTHEGFTVLDFLIDGKSQLVTVGLPASVFKDTHGIRLALDQIKCGSRITLRMRNDSSRPQPFNARLLRLPVA